MELALAGNRNTDRTKCILEALTILNMEQQFELYFQPLFRTKVEEFYGVEALLRWHSPELGWVSPAEFIPLAERYGFIHRITYWVVQKAIHYLYSWRRQGIDLRMAINISALDLEQRSFLDQLFAEIDSYQIDTTKLTLEITETAAIRYPALAARHINELHQAGVNVALDDFGRGHTGLWQLGSLPVKLVKIDQCLVQYLETAKCWPIILRSFIDLAHSLNLKVAAEGVENQKMYRFLQACNCDYVQGFYLSKPLTETHFIRWLKSGHLAAIGQKKQIKRPYQ